MSSKSPILILEDEPIQNILGKYVIWVAIILILIYAFMIYIEPSAPSHYEMQQLANKNSQIIT